MNPHSLLASAAINIGLAFITLSLFSVLKKQPATAAVYYACALSRRRRRRLPAEEASSSLRRFLPSVSWVSLALRVTEGEVIDAHGLDALVVIRLFKFGLWWKRNNGNTTSYLPRLMAISRLLCQVTPS